MDFFSWLINTEFFFFDAKKKFSLLNSKKMQNHEFFSFSLFQSEIYAFNFFVFCFVVWKRRVNFCSFFEYRKKKFNTIYEYIDSYFGFFKNEIFFGSCNWNFFFFFVFGFCCCWLTIFFFFWIAQKIFILLWRWEFFGN